ncbi:ABC transporter substrate-binding protein [Geobacter pelophilus]|uniref:ABC transporter substrate-binding protein n=1 Tax=Geoanaerobacter pelophilus TaxID=60036 RepID=A0AAW4L7V0_9BACT|nr:ABC transporter substrate-binding protein [Geoanaerobacter pelophilus]MBT0664104.1 ABC transporter substrate-binding protein [Geoanaerobacter pelophilus]
MTGLKGAAILITAIFAGFLLGCTQNPPGQGAESKATPATEPLKICTGTTYSILVTIAEQKGLFAKEGLKVELKPYALGRDAMEAMLAGNCDIATSADTPVADFGTKRDDLRIITGIAKSDRLSAIVSWKNAEVHKVRDMKGLRIGVTKGTAPHFFLDLVLNKNRMTEKDVQLQFMKGNELHQAFLERKLDAIVTTDMNAYSLKEKFGNEVVVVDDPGIVLNHGYLTVLDATLQKKKGDINRMMAALTKAELMLNEKPEEAKQLFSAYLKTSPAISEQIWENITPKLSLDAAMVLTLEDNARWLREREGGKAVNKSFKSIMVPEMLQKVSPQSVNF